MCGGGVYVVVVVGGGLRVCTETANADDKREFRNIQILSLILRPWGRAVSFCQGINLTVNMDV